MAYKIVSVPKDAFESKLAVRMAAGRDFAKSGYTVEAVDEKDNEWLVRLTTDKLAEFPFQKKKDDEADAAEKDEAKANKDDEEAADDEAKADSDDPDGDGDDDSDPDKDTDNDGGKGAPGGKELAGQIKSLIGELNKVLQDLGGTADDLAAKHDEKADQLNQIKDLADTGEDVGVGVPGAGVEESGGPVGPTPTPKPGAPGATPPVPKGPNPALKKKPAMPGGMPSTFTRRQHEVVTHPGVNSQGEPITMTAAALELENDPEFADYEVVAMRQDGVQYVAKLRAK